MNYVFLTVFTLLICARSTAQPIVFSIDDVLIPIENNLPLDSVLKTTLPLGMIMTSDGQTLIQADSVVWYGVQGKLSVLLNSEKLLEHLQWDSYKSDSLTYHKIAKDFTAKFGTGITNEDQMLTFVRTGLCINIDKDKIGKFRLFLVKCRGKIR